MKPMLLIACATLFAASASPAWSQARAPGVAETLSPGQIEAGMSPVKTRADACAAKAGRVQGRVVILVTVGPAGEVASASVAEAAGVSPAVASCIAGAARNAMFAATKKGATFPYPFKF